MKNAFRILPALLLGIVISGCEKIAVEKAAPMAVDSISQAASDREDGEETIIEDLGPASGYGLTQDDQCTPVKYKVMCVQHSCESLRNDPVDEWTFNLSYYYIATNGNLIHSGSSVTTSSSSPYGWVTLNHPILKTSALHTANPSFNHTITGTALDFSGSSVQVATTDQYILFDCNYSDNLVTRHKLVHYSDLRNGCAYYDAIATPLNPQTKNLVIADNCTNSSTGSYSTSPILMPYPCVTGN